MEAHGIEFVEFFCKEKIAPTSTIHNLERLSKNRNIAFTRQSFDKSMLQRLRDQNVKLIVTAGCSDKIPVEQWEHYAINYHPSVLPKARGPFPIYRHILKPSDACGITIHETTEEFDSGPILIQEPLSVCEQETFDSLNTRLQALAVKLTTVLFSDFETYYQNPQPQGEGDYWPHIKEEEYTLDWNDNVEKIDRVIRALGSDQSVATFTNKQWAIKSGVVWQEQHALEPGTLVYMKDQSAIIAAKDGFVCLTDFEEDSD
ncbi:MAG: hypothetical protein HKM24_01160 [Gammaproteobacteria bacterium]|nr:hypothetical protein [Gammaproteobacteria bacterium]